MWRDLLARVSTGAPGGTPGLDGAPPPAGRPVRRRASHPLRPLQARLRDAAAGFVHRGWRAVQNAALITAETAAGRRFARFGRGSSMAFPTGSVYGERWIEVGEDTMIGMHVTMCAGMVPGQDLGAQPVLRVGDRCVIGRGSHIVAHRSVEIGDDVFTGPYVYITDQNHGYADPDMPIGRQWPSNDTVSIGSGAWLGAGVIVLPGAVVGKNVVVAAGSVVRGNVPDRCVVAGVPAKVVREYIPGTGWKPPLRGGTHPAPPGA